MDAMNSRQQIILQMVIDQGRVSVVDLAKTTGVSEVTIRQDLNLLENRATCVVRMAMPSHSTVRTLKRA